MDDISSILSVSSLADGANNQAASVNRRRANTSRLYLYDDQTHQNDNENEDTMLPARAQLMHEQAAAVASTASPHSYASRSSEAEDDQLELPMLLDRELTDLGFESSYAVASQRHSISVLLGNALDLIDRFRRQRAAMERTEQQCMQLRDTSEHSERRQRALAEAHAVTERDLAALEEKNRQLQLRVVALNTTVKQTLDENRRLQANTEQRDSQYKHERKKLEKEMEKLRDRVQALSGVAKHKNQLPNLEVSETLQRGTYAPRTTWQNADNGCKKQLELYTELIRDYDHKTKELTMENGELRSFLARLYVTLTLSQSAATTLLDNNNSSNEELDRLLLMPFDQVHKKVNSLFEAQLCRLVAAQEHAKAANDRSSSNSSNRTRLSETPLMAVNSQSRAVGCCSSSPSVRTISDPSPSSSSSSLSRRLYTQVHAAAAVAAADVDAVASSQIGSGDNAIDDTDDLNATFIIPSVTDTDTDSDYKLGAAASVNDEQEQQNGYHEDDDDDDDDDESSQQSRRASNRRLKQQVSDMAEQLSDSIRIVRTQSALIDSLRQIKSANTLGHDNSVGDNRFGDSLRTRQQQQQQHSLTGAVDSLSSIHSTSSESSESESSGSGERVPSAVSAAAAGHQRKRWQRNVPPPAAQLQSDDERRKLAAEKKLFYEQKLMLEHEAIRLRNDSAQHEAKVKLFKEEQASFYETRVCSSFIEIDNAPLNASATRAAANCSGFSSVAKNNNGSSNTSTKSTNKSTVSSLSSSSKNNANRSASLARSLLKP